MMTKAQRRVERIKWKRRNAERLSSRHDYLRRMCGVWCPHLYEPEWLKEQLRWTLRHQRRYRELWREEAARSGYLPDHLGVGHWPEIRMLHELCMCPRMGLYYLDFLTRQYAEGIPGRQPNRLVGI